MKKFNFRLERLLQYKAQIEDQKRRELASKTEELNRQNTIFRDLTFRREEYLRKYAALFVGHVDIEGLKTTRRYLEKIHRDLVNQARKVIDCEKKVERARSELVEGMRDRKKYENLKERKFKSYVRDSNRAEQKTLDEFGAQAEQRKSMNRDRVQSL
jgi:flagellar FliJ protein